jgi:hypothetical protein
MKRAKKLSAISNQQSAISNQQSAISQTARPKVKSFKQVFHSTVWLKADG